MADASTKIAKSTQIVHVGSGASLASGGTVNASTDVSTALSGTGNCASYPRADVALMITATASIAAASTNVYLYRRDLNFDGTSHETAPGASNKNKFMGAFAVQAATTASTTHYCQITDVPLPGQGDCEFYIENALGVNILAGWTLKVTPKTDTGATS